MATTAHTQSGPAPPPVEVIRQPGAGNAPAIYAPPELLHVGDEVDALLAVRLDPTQEDDDE
ncbi:MAG TPA: hypothetical protein VNO82_04715 [Solirubrobacteraceae bacterium]|nr:hypothetical protein [Solirubrobacteraceae bacterium]